MSDASRTLPALAAGTTLSPLAVALAGSVGELDKRPYARLSERDQHMRNVFHRVRVEYYEREARRIEQERKSRG